MISNKKVTGIILAAGSSVRFGKNRNKNFEIVNGKAIIEYSIEIFNKSKYIDDIIIVIKDSEREKILDILGKNIFDKKIKLVNGGVTRQESVYNAIISTQSYIVLIHDGARPLIKNEYINILLQDSCAYDALTLGVESKDTIKIVDDNSEVINTTTRSNTYIIQTPQCFDRKKLLYLHEKYMNEDVTDDCMLFEKEKIKVKVLKGDYTNIKVTTYSDINIVSSFLK